MATVDISERRIRGFPLSAEELRCDDDILRAARSRGGIGFPTPNPAFSALIFGGSLISRDGGVGSAYRPGLRLVASLMVSGIYLARCFWVLASLRLLGADGLRACFSPFAWFYLVLRAVARKAASPGAGPAAALGWLRSTCSLLVGLRGLQRHRPIQGLRNARSLRARGPRARHRARHAPQGHEAALARASRCFIGGRDRRSAIFCPTRRNFLRSRFWPPPRGMFPLTFSSVGGG